MFVDRRRPGGTPVLLEPGLPVQDMQPGGLVSAPDVRAYATREARLRLHQQRFKLDVMRAYRHRCAICTLRERALVQAAHIVPDVEPEGIAAVVNGLALCAIHHLAFDRNLLGIDPEGVVHIAGRLLREIDGPMLRTGLQGFHGGRSRCRAAGGPTGPAPARAALRALRERARPEMPARERVIEAAARQVAAFCEQRSTDDYRIEHAVRGASITIVERRPPWNPAFGSEWSSLKVAQLRYDDAPAAGGCSPPAATTAGTRTSSPRRRPRSRRCSTRSRRTAPASSGAERSRQIRLVPQDTASAVLRR